jgi:hypothetical protein
MRIATIVAGLGGLVLTQAAVAATPGCPPVGAAQTQTRNFCEARWDDLLGRKATGGWTQPRFIGDCLKRCSVKIRMSRGATTGTVVAATAAAAAVSGAVLASRSSKTPANETPASP